MSFSRRERILPTRGTLESLDGAATSSIAAIRNVLTLKKAKSPQLEGQAAWGQYLDHDHHSEEQWGRFGTTSAVIAFALINGREDEPPNHRSVYESHPLDALAPVLPKQWPIDPQRESAHFEELYAEDFQKIMKLAYMVDALEPDKALVSAAEQPQLVDYVLGLSPRGLEGWSTSPAESSDHPRDRHIPTTYVLWALRRFPAAQATPIACEAYEWLAGEVIAENARLGTDLVALAGLAMNEIQVNEAKGERVEQALGKCDQKLTEWARRQRRLAIDRPYFNGYSQGTSTDYIFLTPELLVAKYLIARGNPAKTRRFVLRVIAALTENVMPKTREAKGEQTKIGRGYCVQGGMVRTADQMWVVDLLKSFQRARKREERELLPSPTGWLSGKSALWVLATLGLLGYGAVTIARESNTGAGILSIVGGVLLLGAGLAFEALRGQKD
jgi:hypothetical protein